MKKTEIKVLTCADCRFYRPVDAESGFCKKMTRHRRILGSRDAHAELSICFKPIPVKREKRKA